MARAVTPTRAEASPALKVLKLEFIAGSSLALGNVGRRSPRTEPGGLGGELPRGVPRVILDHAHAGGILVRHAVGSLEIEKHGARGGVTARTEANMHAMFAQKIVGAHDIIDGGDLVV